MRSLLLATAAAVSTCAPAGAVDYVNSLAIPGGATDLSSYSASMAQNRLGGFGSDLIYDAGSNLYYGVTDRGPGGGTLSYAPRIQAFSLNVDQTTGAIGNFQLQQTIVFSQANGQAFDGLAPAAGGPLGNALDSEGLAILKNGDFLVSDEYGPSVYEFSRSGQFVRAYQTPDNIVPKRADGTPDYAGTRTSSPPITSGRQDNRGFEGLTVSADGTKAYAVLQDPLVNEGKNDGRASRNVRIVQFDTATGQSTAQYVYQLSDIAQLNQGLASGDQFGKNDQGRNVGVSSIEALPNGQFLIDERDNRGYGVGDPNGTILPVTEKSLFLADLTGASDASSTSLAGTNGLNGLVPVSKASFLDIKAALEAAGQAVPEKIEGFTFGPMLADGSVELIVMTDNDYSVTQDANTNVQFNVCSDGPGGSVSFSDVPLDQSCPTGTSLIPTLLYGFKISAGEAAALGFKASAAVPETATWAQMIAGFGLAGAAVRRRRRAGALA